MQKPLHEVWLAARSGGYHYRFDGQVWTDTKGQGEFWTQLSRDVSAQAGLALVFRLSSLSCMACELSVASEGAVHRSDASSNPRALCVGVTCRPDRWRPRYGIMTVALPRSVQGSAVDTAFPNERYLEVR